MADDIRMLDWWDGLSEHEQAKWCSAAPGGHISSTMSNTIPVEHHDTGPNGWLTATGAPVGGDTERWKLRPAFREFIERQCHP